MTCSECQVQIFDGELDRGAVAHLTECEECRLLEHEVRLNSAALAELRDDVLLSVAPKRRWLGYAALAASVLIAVAVGSYDDRPEFPEPPAPRIPPRVVQEIPAIPPLVLPGPPPDVKVAVKPARKKEEPLMVKLLTDDPDVVIYWLIDPVQGEQAL